MRSREVSLHNQRHRSKASRSKRKSFPWLLILLPLIIWIGVRAARVYFEQPQAILVLGGAPEREKFTAQFAQEHPDLPIWISSGSPKEYTEWVFSDAGVDLERLNLDYQAVDTVTNFTTLVDELQAQGIQSVYLITSDYHMRRARIIGEIVMGSRGIHLKPIAVPTDIPEEPWSKALRDGGRAILWITTGHTGANLGRLREGRGKV
jgi:uncharacterized SAM-binding protein YcdF (DUF218 family)